MKDYRLMSDEEIKEECYGNGYLEEVGDIISTVRLTHDDRYYSEEEIFARSILHLLRRIEKLEDRVEELENK